MIVAAIILLIASIVFNVIRNHYLILKKSKVNHDKEGFVKVCTLLPSVFLFAFASNFIFPIALAISFGMTLSLFWLFFDLFLNLKRGYPAFFTGSEDGKDDAKTDNFLQSIPQWLHISIKITLVLLTTYFYIIGMSK